MDGPGAGLGAAVGLGAGTEVGVVAVVGTIGPPAQPLAIAAKTEMRRSQRIPRLTIPATPNMSMLHQSRGKPQLAREQAAGTEICATCRKRAHSVGVVETRNGELYRCSLIFDQNLSPAGAAWIKMTTQTVYVPKSGL